MCLSNFKLRHQPNRARTQLPLSRWKSHAATSSNSETRSHAAILGSASRIAFASTVINSILTRENSSAPSKSLWSVHGSCRRSISTRNTAKRFSPTFDTRQCCRNSKALRKASFDDIEQSCNATDLIDFGDAEAYSGTLLEGKICPERK